MTSACVCVCVCVCVLVNPLCLFAAPWTVALQAPLSMEFSRQEYWSQSCPYPVIEHRSPALQPDSLLSEPPGKHPIDDLQFSSVQSLSHVWLFATPWTAARQAFLSITNCRSPPKPMSIELVMPSNHLILCCPLLLLPSIFPSIRVFSNESALHIRGPKYWSFSFHISPSNEHPGLMSFRMDWFDLFAVQGTQESSPTPQFKSINSLVLSFLYSPNFHIHTWPLEKP